MQYKNKKNLYKIVFITILLGFIISLVGCNWFPNGIVGVFFPQPGIGSITLSANPESNVPGGTSTISALVINTEGDVVPDGTTVYFYTNSGTLSADSAVTTDGMAKVTLTLDASMQDGDIATVTAFIGAITNSVEVTCIAGLITEEIALSANPESNVSGGSSTITAIVTKESRRFC